MQRMSSNGFYIWDNQGDLIYAEAQQIGEGHKYGCWSKGIREALG